ncbi:hypothetical protein JZ751_020858 [Albula glossodonta]|uniref:Uncharacterized protein n=1 Tax=Albula glossodonta TaxID=121402 RepID=A0A8T2PIS9_9TELE|nr:hypothetical protein JZ751_020858 [Albula glossodonta]
MFMFPISSVPNISLEVFPVNSSFLTSSDSGLDNTDTIFDEAMENSTFSMTSASGGDVSTVAPSDHALNQEPTAQNDSPVSSSTTITTKPTTISFTTSSTTMFYTTKSTSTTVKLVTEISLNTTSATEQKTEMTDVVNTLLSPSPTISMTTTTIPKVSRPATSTLVTVKKRPSLTTVRTINGPAISMSSSETLAAPPRTSAGKEDGSTNKAILDVAAGPLTRQLVDTSSLLAVLLFGLIFFLVTISLFLTKAFDSYKKRDYTQIDYLINGMYSDSGV